MNIKVSYRSVDGVRITRRFKTLKFARKFAQDWVGKHPDIGSNYAVSYDGIGAINVDGCSLRELFPTQEEIELKERENWTEEEWEA